MQQMQEKRGERGKCRKRGSCRLSLGHVVKNHMTVILYTYYKVMSYTRWGAIVECNRCNVNETDSRSRFIYLEVLEYGYF